MASVEDLLRIMSKLREPEGGCPWDLEQSFQTIAPYTIEEAYEVDDAIAREDWAALRDELGDLLLQAIYHAQLAAEAGHFRFADVVDGICEKLVRRHPHVFGSAQIDSASAQLRAWDEHKAVERTERAEREGREPGVLDDVPLGLPALLRAAKLKRRAARARLDDPASPPRERARVALAAHDPGTGQRVSSEALGDTLLACVGLAVEAELDPEAALREASRRFEQRVRAREKPGQRS